MEIWNYLKFTDFVILAALLFDNRRLRDVPRCKACLQSYYTSLYFNYNTNFYLSELKSRAIIQVRLMCQSLSELPFS